MNYLALHDKLIERSRNRVRSGDIFYESHHILPRCMGGADAEANLTLLTPHEHRIIHKLLVKIHPKNRRLAYAASFMYAAGKNHPNRTPPRYPNQLRKAVADARRAAWEDEGGRERMMAGIVAAWDDPVRRAANGTRVAEYWSKPGNKKANSEKLKRYWEAGGHVANQPALTPEQRTAIHARSVAGETQMALAAEYGVSRRCIADAINKVSGGKIVPVVVDQLEIETAVWLRTSEGLSWREIGAVMNKHPSTIRRHVLQNSA